MRHNLKIKQKYLLRILRKEKTFEIRFNDRDFQAGDEIYFLPIEDDDHNVYEIATNKKIPIYEITYIHHDSFLESGFVVLSIRAINERN